MTETIRVIAVDDTANTGATFPITLLASEVISVGHIPDGMIKNGKSVIGLRTKDTPIVVAETQLEVERLLGWS